MSVVDEMALELLDLGIEIEDEEVGLVSKELETDDFKDIVSVSPMAYYIWYSLTGKPGSPPECVPSSRTSSKPRCGQGSGCCPTCS